MRKINSSRTIQSDLRIATCRHQLRRHKIGITARKLIYDQRGSKRTMREPDHWVDPWLDLRFSASTFS